jgi:FkbM family methyltransferase
MKRLIVGIIHKLIIRISMDDLFVRLSKHHLFFQKFIPLHSYYPQTIKKAERNKAFFSLNVNDYMQWHLWAGINDLAWQKAIMYEGGVIVDVGTNVGAFALKTLANTKKAIVHTFEPNPFIHKNFRNNVNLNKNIEKRLIVNSCALSNRRGFSQLYINSSNSGASSLNPDNSIAESIEVELNTLDNYINDNKITNIKFIKIDVEGFEPQVLEGAYETISKYKPDLFIEVTPSWWCSNGYDVMAVLQSLKKLNYRFFPIVNENKSDIDELELETVIKFKDQFNLYLKCH